MKQNNLAKKLTTWVVIIAAILAIPFFAGFPWTSYDYIFAGVVLAVLAAIYETVTRNMKDFKQKLIVAAVLLGVIVLILGWAATGPDSEALMNQGR